MAVFGNYGITESLIETKVSRKLSADPDAHFREPPGAGIVVRPGHQGCPDAVALVSGIDGDTPDLKEAGRVVESQAADRSTTELSQGTARSLDVIADGCL